MSFDEFCKAYVSIGFLAFIRKFAFFLVAILCEIKFVLFIVMGFTNVVKKPRVEAILP
jgi:hypothetical protein